MDTPQVLKTVLLARQPIVDTDHHVVAYELLHDRDQPGHDHHQAVRVLHDALITFGRDHAADDHAIHIRVPTELITGRGLLDLELARIALQPTTPTDPELTAALLAEHRHAGYQFIWDDDTPAAATPDDLVRISLDPRAPELAIRRILHHRDRGHTVLADQVHTPDQFDRAVAAGAHLLQGFYFTRPRLVATTRPVGLAGVHAELLAAVAADTMDYREIEAAFATDPTLTDRFLRFLAARSGKFRPQTIHDGLVVLGEDAIRRWVTLITMVEAVSDAPPQLYTLAAARSRLCEQLEARTGNRAPLEAFTCGLFSVLGPDATLKRTDADELPISLPAREALAGREGRYRTMLQIALALEHGRFDGAATLAADLGLGRDDIAAVHQDAIGWADHVVGALAQVR